MPNSFDFDGRSPSNRQLFVAGACVVLILGVIAALMVAKSKGKLSDAVHVSAELVNVGDGLPAKSDVKFRGVLVGFVSDVVPAGTGQSNIVRIDLKPEYAASIPDTVTARVVPSNVFAVSSVQLVDKGQGAAPLRDGAVIEEDHSLSTVLFQTTLNKVREVLAAVGRRPSSASVGVLSTLGEATHGRGARLLDAGRDLNRIVAQLNTIVATDTGPSTISALSDAAGALRNTAPELFSALGEAVAPMQTLAAKRSELTNLLAAGVNTAGTMGEAFDNQADRLINITTQLTPVIGVVADNAAQFGPILTRVGRLSDRINEVWDTETHLLTIKAIVSFTPDRSYIRSDCPRYGELAGPSCQTAPELPTAPALMPALASMGYPPPRGVTENRPNLAQPRGSIPPPGSPLAPTQPDAPELPTSENPAPPAGVQPQSAVMGGNVGPVGSRREREQLSTIVGGEATASSQLLLGPLARGSTVHIAPDPGGSN